MNEYRGIVYLGKRKFYTTVHATDSMDARMKVAREYQSLHSRYTIQEILVNTSVQKVRFGVF